MTTTSATTLANTPLRDGIAYGNRLTWTTDANRSLWLDDAVAVGAKWIRVDLSWKDVQWAGPTSYNWAPFDAIMTAASARHLQVLPTIGYTPPWARAAGCTDEHCPPADPTAFATFAGKAAARYAPLGVHAWEVWNEENISAWPSPDPVAYTTLLKATSASIKGADPKALVILGGLASALTADHRISQMDFLAKVCSLGGCAAIDAVGYHPYSFPFLPSYKPTTWHTAWDKMIVPDGSLESVLKSYGYTNIPVWITEYGAPTGGPGLAADDLPNSKSPATTHVTEAYQARFAADAPITAAGDDYVQGFFWYADRDKSADPSSCENFFGLIRADGTRKPAFAALASAYQTVGTLRIGG